MRRLGCAVGAALALIVGSATPLAARAADVAGLASGAPADTDSPSDAAAKPDASASRVRSIADSEIPAQAEQDAAGLRQLVKRLEASADLEAAEADVAASERTTAAALATVNAALQQGARLNALNDLAQVWRDGRADIAQRSEALAGHTRESDAALAQLRSMLEVWKQAASDARANDAPQDVIARAEAVQADIATTREQIVAIRDRLLGLQDRTQRQLAAADDILARLEQEKNAAVGRIGVRNAPPLWRALGEAQERASAGKQIALEASNELRLTAYFLQRHPAFAPSMLAAFAVLALLLRRARAVAAPWRRDESEIARQLAVLDVPYSIALLFTLMGGYFLFQGMPRLLFNALGVLAIAPIVQVARRFIPPFALAPTYAAVALRVAGMLLEFVSPSALVEQVFLSGMLTAGSAFFLLWMRPAHLDGLRLAPADADRLPVWRWGVGLLAVDLCIALVAVVLGYMQLARVLSATALAVLNSGLAFYSAARVLLGIWAFLLEVRPLASLRAVSSHRALIAHRTRTVVGLLAFAGWVVVTRNNLSFFGLRPGTLDRIAAAKAHFGSIVLSVGDLFTAGVTVCASFVVSRFVRFVLEEEIFPRIQLSQGVPYALSMLVHYAIVATGVLFGLATLGFDPQRLTVIVGALGVGIGFGLQTIVNNLSSGLILLFERPIKVGDTVQVGQVTGEVKRIGPRSSTVRTGEGAEVIVPNASLVSETVTNWTLSDRSRRFEIAIGIAPGLKPRQVMQILKETAAQHPEALANPAPSAFFTGFSGDSLNFEVRVWVGDLSRVGAVKSDIATAISEALDTARLATPAP